jgi:hypothetical protein
MSTGFLTQRFELLPGEDPDAIQAQRDELLEDWGGEYQTLRDMVEHLVIQRCRLGRARALETRLLADPALDEPARLKCLATLGRYIRGIELSMRDLRREITAFFEMTLRVARRNLNDQIKLELSHAPSSFAPTAAKPAPPAAAPAPALNRAERRRQEHFARKEAKRAA